MMSFSSFLPPLIGGVLIGIAAAVLLLFNGRILGVTGILAGAVRPTAEGERTWRLAFVTGLVAGGLGLIAFNYPAFPSALRLPIGTAIVAGLLVGFGTRLGNGCTSGHGVCGIGRFSVRSILATITFIATGALTVWIVRHGVGS